jgi:hypothetical protein
MSTGYILICVVFGLLGVLAAAAFWASRRDRGLEDDEDYS